MPTNFRTYEAQSRLLAAVIASNPSLKLNFKEIAKLYGESTPLGMEFQFRAIRKDAKALRAAVDNGESPLLAPRHGPPTATLAASAASTPPSTKRKAPGSGAASASGGRGRGRVAKRVAVPKPRGRPRIAESPFSNEEESLTTGDEVDFEQLDLTPISTPNRPPVSLPPPSAAASATSAALAAADGSAAATPTAIVATPTSRSNSNATAVLYATPVLSIDDDLAENEASDAEQFFTAPQIRGRTMLYQPLQPPPPSHSDFYGSRQNSIVVDDGDAGTGNQHDNNASNHAGNDNDDDDDDNEDVYCIDTPSKKPKTKMTVPTQASAAAAAAPVVLEALAPASSASASTSPHANSTTPIDTNADPTPLPALPSPFEGEFQQNWDALGFGGSFGGSGYNNNSNDRNNNNDCNEPDGSSGAGLNGVDGTFSFGEAGTDVWTQPYADFSPFNPASLSSASFSQSLSQAFYDDDGAI